MIGYLPCRRCPTPALNVSVAHMPGRRVCNHVDCEAARRIMDAWRPPPRGAVLVMCPGCGKVDGQRRLPVDVPLRCVRCDGEFLLLGTWPEWLQPAWWWFRRIRRDVRPAVVRGPHGIAPKW